MKQYSIRRYVALVTLVPMIVIAACLEFIFLSNNFSELDLHTVERAKLLASQLGSSSEYGVVSNNQPFLNNLAQGVSQQQDVRAVAILNSSGHILVETGNISSTEKIVFLGVEQAMPDSPSPLIQYVDKSLLVFQPIMPQTVILNEFEATPVAKPIGAVILKISLARTVKLKWQELLYTIAATGIILALCGYIVNLAVRRIVHPINKLSSAIQTIGQGNLEARASVSTHITEVVVLSNGINHMAEQLQHERSVLQQRVDDATLCILNSKEKAEQATLFKSKFLAAASHDLRQPIHAQGLFLDVLSRTELTAHQRDLLTNARTASNASSDMINTLLDYSRIEAGVIKPQLQPFRLQLLLNKIEIEFVPQADAKNLVYRSRETKLVVTTDPMLLELILRNLVSNAIRYTDHGGVLVACRQRGNQTVLEVWDTGIGIAPQDQKEVFREFHQLGNPERDRRKGLGLGLAIAEGLSRTLGHDLSLVSIPQRGSVFRITLPVDTSIPAAQLAMAQSKTRLLNARLLVIDDDEIVREGMLYLLRDWGCECEAAESIEEALALARINAPNVVISDYRLREQRTGVEAIAALRALLGDALPALLITGDTAPERLREAQASGIPLLHKPVSPSKLYRKLVELQQG